MPQHVRMSRIDWHYEHASADLRAFISASLHLASRDHTLQTFGEQLRKLAKERTDLVVDALVADAYRAYHLFRARGGAVTSGEVEERPEGALDRAVELPFDDVAYVTPVRDAARIQSMFDAYDGVIGPNGRLNLPLHYGAEAPMREVLGLIARSIDVGAHRFVAHVELDRFLVELRPNVASIARLVPVTEPALVAHLLRGDLAAVPLPAPAPGEKREQRLFWPRDMLDAIVAEGVRSDRSLSYVLQLAWKTSRAQVLSSDRETIASLVRGHSSEKVKHSLFLTAESIVEASAHAERIESSLSVLFQAAWVLARTTIAAQPPR